LATQLLTDRLLVLQDHPLQQSRIVGASQMGWLKM